MLWIDRDGTTAVETERQAGHAVPPFYVTHIIVSVVVCPSQLMPPTLIQSVRHDPHEMWSHGRIVTGLYTRAEQQGHWSSCARSLASASPSMVVDALLSSLSQQVSLVSLNLFLWVASSTSSVLDGIGRFLPILAVAEVLSTSITL